LGVPSDATEITLLLTNLSGGTPTTKNFGNIIFVGGNGTGSFDAVGGNAITWSGPQLIQAIAPTTTVSGFGGCTIVIQGSVLN
jgi:hypothetical protein